AETRRRIAHPGVVAPVVAAADDRIGAGADTGLAGVAPGARVPVVARGSVGLRVRGARPRRGVARTGVVALVASGADDRVRPYALAGAADVGLRARVAVVARREEGLLGVRAATGRRLAGPRIVALIARAAHDGRAADAEPGLAGVGLRAAVA